MTDARSIWSSRTSRRSAASCATRWRTKATAWSRPRRGAGAGSRLRRSKPDLVMLDLGLPDRDGVEFIRDLRGWSDVPILILSARSDENDKIVALDAGADDYLTKPFSASANCWRGCARCCGATSRLGEAARSSRASATCVVDLSRRSVERAGEPVHLTPHRIPPAGAADRQRRQGADPPPAAARSVGASLCREQALPAHLCRPPAAEARSRSGAAAPPADRNRRRLPLRFAGARSMTDNTATNRASTAALDAGRARRGLRRHRHQPAVRAQGSLRQRPPSGADHAGQRARHPVAGVLVADRRRLDQVRGR